MTQQPTAPPVVEHYPRYLGVTGDDLKRLQAALTLAMRHVWDSPGTNREWALEMQDRIHDLRTS